MNPYGPAASAAFNQNPAVQNGNMMYQYYQNPALFGFQYGYQPNIYNYPVPSNQQAFAPQNNYNNPYYIPAPQIIHPNQYALNAPQTQPVNAPYYNQFNQNPQININYNQNKVYPNTKYDNNHSQPQYMLGDPHQIKNPIN